MGGTNPISLSEYFANASSGFTSGVSAIPNIGNAIGLGVFKGKGKGISIASATINLLYNTLNPYKSFYKNPYFYEYLLDVADGSSISDGNGDMYDGGNITTIYCDGLFSSTLLYNNTSGETTILNGKSVVNIALGVSTPLMYLCKSGSRANLGFRKTGNLGADGGGSQTSDVVYSGASLYGFTVYAWRRLVFNAGDPSICDLYFAIGDTSSTFYSTSMITAIPSTTDDGFSQFYMDVANVLMGCILLSKSGGVAVTVAECQTVINNITLYLRTLTPPIYNFTSHTFTNAGASGRFGPILSQTQNAYSGESWAQDVNNLTMTTQGMQIWIVPRSGTYVVTCVGACGGSLTSPGSIVTGGLGAVMIGSFSFGAGERLKIMVGQKGGQYGYTGGGGGGSYVAKNDNTPLIVAGGGGGGGDSGGNGFNASIGTSGTAGSGNGTPGIDGYGSTFTGNNGYGQSGAGFLGDGNGRDTSSGWGNGEVARGFINGGYGAQESGTNTTASCNGAPGGFGGGGSGSCNGGGGGGGYSGGANGGGGGGSYNIGLYQSNSVSNNGQGYITIL